MRRLSSFTIIMCLLSVISACSSVMDKMEAQTPPNIVFILLDDWGWQDAAFMGSEYYLTPNMDKLASQSYKFTQAYSSSPNCAPTRAALYSGQYPQRTGIYTVKSSERGHSIARRIVPTPNNTVLPDKVDTIAERLQSVGYKTAFIGKWHMGEGANGGPLTQGFDINIAGNHTGTPRSYFSPYKNEELTNGPKGEYLPDRLSAEAVKFIKSAKEQPFFLMLSHYAVHSPIKAPLETVKKHLPRQGNQYQNNPTYAAMLEHSDKSVARVLETLEKHGLDENTWVILTSDNGGFSKATQAPDLRGTKGMLYEGGVRVPLLIKAPKQAVGKVIDEPVSTLDFYPSLLAMTGKQIAKTQPLDGLNILPLLTEQKLDRDALFFHFPAYLQSTRQSGSWRTTPASVIRMGDYKLIEFFEYGQLELYNIKNDLKETHNLALEQPDVTAKLYRKLKHWQKTSQAPIPNQLNPDFDNKYLLPRKSYITWQDVQAKLSE